MKDRPFLGGVLARWQSIAKRPGPLGAAGPAASGVPGSTMIDPLVFVIAPSLMSVAVTVLSPAVFSVTDTVVVPLSVIWNW